MIDKGRKIAAHILEAAEADLEFKDGKFTVAGTDRSLGITEVAKAAFAGKVPVGVEIGLYETATWTPTTKNIPNSAHICEVEIDPETGVLELVKYTAVHDVGVELNPL